MLFFQKLEKNEIQVQNDGLNDFLKKYTFRHITENLTFENNQFIFQNINQSESIIINYFNESTEKPENGYFIISFQYTILIISQSSLNYLHDLFATNSKSNFIFIDEKTANIFNENIQYDNNVKKYPI